MMASATSRMAVSPRPGDSWCSSTSIRNTVLVEGHGDPYVAIMPKTVTLYVPSSNTSSSGADGAWLYTVMRKARQQHRDQHASEDPFHAISHSQ